MKVIIPVAALIIFAFLYHKMYYVINFNMKYNMSLEYIVYNLHLSEFSQRYFSLMARLDKTLCEKVCQKRAQLWKLQKRVHSTRSRK